MIALLGDLFQGTHAVVCPGAADFNQDRRVNVSDAIAIAMYLFSGGTAPSADPGLTCAMK